MKSTAKRLQYCLLVIGLLVFGSGYAQNFVTYAGSKNNAGTHTTVQDNRQTLFDGLKELNLKKEIYFLFSDPSLANTSMEPLKDTRGETEDILDQWLKGTGIRYKKINEKKHL